MERNYNGNLTSVVYNWLLTMEQARPCQNTCSICFSNDRYHAVINFYDHNLMELIIQDNGKIVFYLHFEIKDFKVVSKNIRSFFEFLKKPPRKDDLHIKELKKEGVKILLSCSSGMTTSYFAYLMQEALDKGNFNVKVDAISYLELDKVQEKYDYILLAPQIAYKFNDYKNKYGVKVMLINTMDFASGNVNGVINNLLVN